LHLFRVVVCLTTYITRTLELVKTVTYMYINGKNIGSYIVAECLRPTIAV